MLANIAPGVYHSLPVVSKPSLVVDTLNDPVTVGLAYKDPLLKFTPQLLGMERILLGT